MSSVPSPDIDCITLPDGSCVALFCRLHGDLPEDLYDVARQVTDEVFGQGTYAELNRDHPDPGVQRAIQRWRDG